MSRRDQPGAELAAAVPEREYLRLLGLPRGRALEGDLRERADGARAWYAEHGQPFVAARRVGVAGLGPAAVRLDTGTIFESVPLAQRLRDGEAHALVALAASAGPEVADETRRLWAIGRPDEAYFLDRFAVAVTERLVFWASATICRASEPARETLLPHLSPGCGHWDLADQHALMALLTGEDGGTTLGPMALLPSGALVRSTRCSPRSGDPPVVRSHAGRPLPLVRPRPVRVPPRPLRRGPTFVPRRPDEPTAPHGSLEDARPARRRRHGHAAPERRPRVGPLRRGLEPGSSRPRAARSSAPTPKPAPTSCSPTPSAPAASC